MPPFLGIDLGTLFTMAASTGPSGRAAVVAGRSGRRMPSFVCLGHSSPAVGREAVAADPACVAEPVKSMLGDPGRRLRGPLSRYARPEEGAALLLARMHADAERALGTRVTDTVLTVPATFDLAARQAVRDAARIAGLRVPILLNEPTAATLAYRDRLPPVCTVLVFSLGGGVFDASVLRIEPGRVEVCASVGDRRLGGWDWDNPLMRLLQDRLTAAGGPDLLTTGPEEAYLRTRARAAKHRLSSTLQTEVPIRYGGGTWGIPVSRREFEAATRHPLGRARVLIEGLLGSGRVRRAEIDRVLLVGGTTRMPAVRQMLQPLLGVPLVSSLAPEETVALGAASYRPDLDIRDVASHGLGLLARNVRSGQLRNVTVVPAGAALPAAGGAVFTTGEDGPAQYLLDITVGDGVEAAAVRTVHRETVRLETPPGTPVEVRCSYDREELPQVEVRTVPDRRVLCTFEVRDRGGMTEGELHAAGERLAEAERSSRR